MLLEHMGKHMRERGEVATAERFLGKARALNQQASRFQKIAIGQESLSEENLRWQPAVDEHEESGTDD